MPTSSRRTYAKNEATNWPIPNYWDIVALMLVVGLIVLLGIGAKAMTGQYQLGQTIAISLNPKELPYYSLCTVLRMLIALLVSLLFTFCFGTWAAKSRHAERIIIPCIDILQSVPVLGFLSIAITSFIGLFAGSLLGPECAAIFAIFTAQVWNMTLSFYQSLSTIPEDLKEAAAMFHLSTWQKFWRLEVPFAMPGLLWNMMMSMSGSWIFLVAAEAITVGPYHITLPGVGSYIASAIAHQDMRAITYVILTMLVVITLYDQILFRPLVAWAEKFKAEQTASDVIPQSWVLDLFQRTRLFSYLGTFIANFVEFFINNRLLNYHSIKRKKISNQKWQRLSLTLGYIVLFIFLLLIGIALWRFIFNNLSLQEAIHVSYLGLITAIRVASVILISSLIWIPVGVWVGLNPRLAQLVQPVAQFLAAFPANLLFPLVVILILKYNLNINIWTSPLMILGPQWYILFNVIAGTSALPKNMLQAMATLNVHGWLWWRRFILPGIYPYYITGAITAAGGAWNISIIAELVRWGPIQLKATGLGAYIAIVTQQGDFPRLVLGIIIMSLYVLIINRLIWRPLYRMAEERFHMG
jgi:NitT/TauT family transport system permease protein